MNKERRTHLPPPGPYEKEISKNWRDHRIYPNPLKDIPEDRFVWEYMRRNREYQENWDLVYKEQKIAEKVFKGIIKDGYKGTFYFKDRIPETGAPLVEWNKVYFRRTKEMKRGIITQPKSWFVGKWRLHEYRETLDEEEYLRLLKPTKPWRDFISFEKTQPIEELKDMSQVFSFGPKSLALKKHFGVMYEMLGKGSRTPFFSVLKKNQIPLVIDARTLKTDRSISQVTTEFKELCKIMRERYKTQELRKKAKIRNENVKIKWVENLRIFDGSVMGEPASKIFKKIRPDLSEESYQSEIREILKNTTKYIEYPFKVFEDCEFNIGE